MNVAEYTVSAAVKWPDILESRRMWSAQSPKVREWQRKGRQDIGVLQANVMDDHMRICGGGGSLFFVEVFLGLRNIFTHTSRDLSGCPERLR